MQEFEVRSQITTRAPWMSHLATIVHQRVLGAKVCKVVL